MNRLRMERFVLGVLDKFARTMARPFAEAESIERYAIRGYVLFGIILTIIFLTMLLFGGTSNGLPGILIFLYKVARARFPFLPEQPATVLVVPIVVYGILFLSHPVRNVIGEKFADLFFGILDRLLAAGEWFLERRWISLFLVITLVGGLGFGVTWQIEKRRQAQAARRAYSTWLAQASDLIEYTTFTNPEVVGYRKVQSYWRAEFANIADQSDVGESGLCLKDMLDHLYSTDDPRSWIDSLASKRTILEKDLSCPLKASQSIQQALPLMHLLMGRIYNRLFDVTWQAQDLIQALTEFRFVEAWDSLTFGSAPRYRSSTANGKGIVYSVLLSIYLNSSQQPFPPSLKPPCNDASDCARQAYDSYEEAGRKYDLCTFEDKRKVNNEADLLIKIAEKYTIMIQNPNAVIFAQWLTSRGALARELESRAATLLSCTPKDPFITPPFVTAAQAFAMAAQLHMEAGEDSLRDARSAGFYLFLASNLEPQNVAYWHLTYFCSVFRNPATKNEFQAQLAPPIDGLKTKDDVLPLIQGKCPSNL